MLCVESGMFRSYVGDAFHGCFSSVEYNLVWHLLSGEPDAGNVYRNTFHMQCTMTVDYWLLDLDHSTVWSILSNRVASGPVWDLYHTYPKMVNLVSPAYPLVPPGYRLINKFSASSGLPNSFVTSHLSCEVDYAWVSTVLACVPLVSV